jgi:hypothetical protein
MELHIIQYETVNIKVFLNTTVSIIIYHIYTEFIGAFMRR